MTKKQAVEQVVDYCNAYLKISLSLDDAERLLDFMTMEDGENGIGLLPPLTKQGRYQWDSPSTDSKN